MLTCMSSNSNWMRSGTRTPGGAREMAPESKRLAMTIGARTRSGKRAVSCCFSHAAPGNPDRTKTRRPQLSGRGELSPRQKPLPPASLGSLSRCDPRSSPSPRRCPLSESDGSSSPLATGAPGALARKVTAATSARRGGKGQAPSATAAGGGPLLAELNASCRTADC